MRLIVRSSTNAIAVLRMEVLELLHLIGAEATLMLFLGVAKLLYLIDAEALLMLCHNSIMGSSIDAIAMLRLNS
jgi:hypothetical protein